MPYTHILQQNNHANFLAQNRIDPISGDAIQENDKVVICASCKSVFLIDSWNYINQTHCEQKETLKKIPIPISIIHHKKKEETPPFQFTQKYQISNNEVPSNTRSSFLNALLLILSSFISIYPMIYSENTLFGLVIIIISYILLGSIADWVQERIW